MIEIILNCSVISYCVDYSHCFYYYDTSRYLLQKINQTMLLSNYNNFVLLVISYISINYAFADNVLEEEIRCIKKIAELFKIEGVKISTEERDLTNLTKEACAKNAIRYFIYVDQERRVDINYLLLLRNNILPGSLEAPRKYCETKTLTKTKSRKQQKMEQERQEYCLRHLRVFSLQSAGKALDNAYMYMNLEIFNGTDEENANGLNFQKYYMEEIINLVQVNKYFDSPELYCKNYGKLVGVDNPIIDQITGEYLTWSEAERRERERNERNEIMIRNMEEEEEKRRKEMEFSERMYYLELNDKFGSTSNNSQFNYQGDDF